MENLQKAAIYDVNKSGGKIGSVNVTCMFNPYEYTVSKTNSFQEKSKNKSNVPEVDFTKAGAQTLKLSLIFDTYEDKKDVSITTNKLWKLMEPSTRKESDETKKVSPPDVAFEWGVFLFTAVITNMTQKFTLFLDDGTPVRAKVDVTFTQYVDRNDYPKQNPTSGGGPTERVWQVVQGDRLDTLAAKFYDDPTKWRMIAERNDIVNPLSLRAGQQISIPQL